MADQQVKQITTPVSEAEMTRALIDAVRELYGINLNKEQTALLIAQNNIETDNRRAMHNYNIGNITHVNGDGWDYFVGGDKTRDGKGGWKPIKLKFRSYPSLNVAAKDYIKNLHNRAGGSVWKEIIDGNAETFSKALKKSKYYEADEKTYTSALSGRVKDFHKGKSYELSQSGNFEKSKPYDTNQTPNQQVAEVGFTGELNKKTILDRIDEMLGKLANTNNQNNLAENKILIKINSVDLIDSIEFSRILKAALDEELDAKCDFFTDDAGIDIECKIHGPEASCYDAVEYVTKSIAKSFKDATKKIGGIGINYSLYKNIDSNKKELSLDIAKRAYVKFHLKFI